MKLITWLDQHLVYTGVLSAVIGLALVVLIATV